MDCKGTVMDFSCVKYIDQTIKRHLRKLLFMKTERQCSEAVQRPSLMYLVQTHIIFNVTNKLRCNNVNTSEGSTVNSETF